MFDATKRKFSDVMFESVDTQEPSGGELAGKYGVRGIPHVVMLDSGGKVLFSGNPPIDQESFQRMVQQFH